MSSAIRTIKPIVISPRTITPLTVIKPIVLKQKALPSDPIDIINEVIKKHTGSTLQRTDILKSFMDNPFKYMEGMYAPLDNKTRPIIKEIMAKLGPSFDNKIDYNNLASSIETIIEEDIYKQMDSAISKVLLDNRLMDEYTINQFVRDMSKEVLNDIFNP